MIKLGSDQTGHSGVLTCVTDLPGPVTLSASDPGVTLTPSSFTVGGMMKQDLPDLEMIDFAFVNWIKSLNIFATYPDGWKKVPVI
jgi:hypothetical protein